MGLYSLTLMPTDQKSGANNISFRRLGAIRRNDLNLEASCEVMSILTSILFIVLREEISQITNSTVMIHVINKQVRGVTQSLDPSITCIDVSNDRVCCIK